MGTDPNFCDIVQAFPNSERALLVEGDLLRTADDRGAAAEVAAVLRELGIESQLVRTPNGEFGVELPGGAIVGVAVASRPTVERVRRLVARGSSPTGAVMLVADQLDPGVRRTLLDARWGWLDRSGHLRLVAPPVHLDTRVDSLIGPDPSPPTPFTRPTALAVALVLLDLVEVASTRTIAATAGVSVAATHDALTDFATLGLIDDKRPRHRELFWAVAAHWKVRWFPLASGPLPGIPDATRALLDFGFDDLSRAGWAEVGDRAARALGAPLAADSRPKLYLPGRRALTWALRTWEQARDDRHATAFLAVPKATAATRRRVEVGLEWPAAHPMVVALTLASDGDPRSQEILEGWTDLPDGVRRVW